MNIKVKLYDGETGRTAKVNFEGVLLNPKEILKSLMAFVTDDPGPMTTNWMDTLQPKDELPPEETWEGPEDEAKELPSGPEEAATPHRSQYDTMRERGYLVGPSLSARFPLDYEQAVLEARQMDGDSSNGIKIDSEGHPMFQTRYICTCGKASKRFVYNRSTHCRSHCCNTRLKIEYASNKNLRDVNGNYYKAIKVYEG